MSPRLRGNDPLRAGSGEVLGDPDHTGHAPHLHNEMVGFHILYADGGHDRPAHVVENIEEVELRFVDEVRPVLECGYCEDRTRTRSREEALRWWNSHECKALELAEQRAIVYDLAERGLGLDPPESLAA